MPTAVEKSNAWSKLFAISSSIPDFILRHVFLLRKHVYIEYLLLIVSKTQQTGELEPKNTVSDWFVIRDLCGRCIFVLCFQRLTNVLKLNWLQLVHSELSQNENCDKLYSVHVAYAATCLFKKSFQSFFFSFTEYPMILFIVDFLPSLILRDVGEEADPSDTKLSRADIVRFVSKRMPITKTFKWQCPHTNESP